MVSDITSNCTTRMSQVSFKGTVYCEYCVDSIVNSSKVFDKKYSNRCLSCPKAYFETCYADYSELKEGFWREENTVDSDKIFSCSVKRNNCVGGNNTSK